MCYKLLDDDFIKLDVLNDFLWRTQNPLVHDKIHWIIGGAFGCDLLDPLYDLGYISEENSFSLCIEWPKMIKTLYRAGLVYPKLCEVNAVDSSLSTCGFTCNYRDNSGLEETLKINLKEYMSEDMTDADWTTIADFVCEEEGRQQIFYGDQRESASAGDPAFWPIHPTVERMFHVRQILGWSDYTWSEWVEGGLNSDICTDNECYQVTSDSIESTKSCCLGHFENDGMLDWISGNNTRTIGTTNGQYLLESDPTSSDYPLPYIYSSFSWSHCSSTNSDIDATIQDLISQSTGI